MDRSKISSDQKRFFIALSLSFFANTPFKGFKNIESNAVTLSYILYKNIRDRFYPPPILHQTLHLMTM